MGRAVNQHRASRESVVMPASCRTNPSGQGEFMIVDLTAEGCRIFTKALPVSEGLELRIRPASFESLPGVIRWVRGSFAGIEFDKPLYGPVADHLQSGFRSGR